MSAVTPLSDSYMLQLNTLRLCYRNNQFNVVEGNNHCFFWDP